MDLLPLFLGDEFAASFLLDHGIKVNVKRDYDSASPLHLISNHSHLGNVMQTLLDKGASMTETNEDGM